MEEMEPKPSPTKGSASQSFRLRSSSLNTLRLRRVFDLFDGNRDGEITVDELCRALDRLGLGADPAELSSTVSSFIRPGLAGLEFEDFQRLHRSLGDALLGFCDNVDDEMEEEDLWEAFKVFDENGDGFICAMELQAVLSKLGFPEGSEIGRVEDMICSFDRNNDGRVDFDEFKIMMRRIVPVPSS